MSKLLLEEIELVKTEVLGDFVSPQLIGHHYGDLRSSRVRCHKITPQLWLVGAHPWRAVTRCWVGDRETFSFEPRIKEDTDGVVRQYVYLSLPPSNDGFTVEVTGLAKESSVNGKLLENPDEIIEDIASLVGRSFNFPLFREACSAIRLKIAGSVTENRTVRDYIAEILNSCGALWLGNNAIFHPSELGYAAPVLFPSAFTEEIQTNDVAGKLDIYYNWNSARGWNGSYMQLTAKGCQYDRSGEIYAKWLRKPVDVERLGRAILGKRAGDFVRVKATVPGYVANGSVLELSGVNWPGAMRVLETNATDVETEVVGEVILATHPLIAISHFTNEAGAQRSERIDVTIFDTGECEITIFDSQNKPMADVAVTLDGKVTKTTNDRGMITLIIAKGDHTLTLSGPGIENSDPFPLFIP